MPTHSSASCQRTVLMEHSLAPLHSSGRFRGLTSNDAVTPVSPRCRSVSSPGSGRGQEGWEPRQSGAMESCVLGTSLFPADGLSLWPCPWRTLQVPPVAVAPERALCTRPFGKRVAVGMPQQAPACLSQPPGGCGPPRLPGAHCCAADQIPKLPHTASLTSTGLPPPCRVRQEEPWAGGREAWVLA